MRTPGSLLSSFDFLTRPPRTLLRPFGRIKDPIVLMDGLTRNLPYDDAPNGTYVFGSDFDGRIQTLTVIRNKITKEYSSNNIFVFAENLSPIPNKMRPTTYYLRNQATFSNINYDFGQKTHQFPLTEESPEFVNELLELSNKTLESLNASPLLNGCHISYYPDGKAGLEPHVDDEPVIDQNVPIVSISFGCSRRFCFYRSQTKEERDAQVSKSRAKVQPPPKPIKIASLILNSGDMIIMTNMQSGDILHGVEKDTKVKDKRINLTFRRFHNP